MGYWDDFGPGFDEDWAMHQYGGSKHRYASNGHFKKGTRKCSRCSKYKTTKSFTAEQSARPAASRVCNACGGRDIVLPPKTKKRQRPSFSCDAEEYLKAMSQDTRAKASRAIGKEEWGEYTWQERLDHVEDFAAENNLELFSDSNDSEDKDKDEDEDDADSDDGPSPWSQEAPRSVAPLKRSYSARGWGSHKRDATLSGAATKRARRTGYCATCGSRPSIMPYDYCGGRDSCIDSKSPAELRAYQRSLPGAEHKLEIMLANRAKEWKRIKQRTGGSKKKSEGGGSGNQDELARLLKEIEESETLRLARTASDADVDGGSEDDDEAAVALDAAVTLRPAVSLDGAVKLLMSPEIREVRGALQFIEEQLRWADPVGNTRLLEATNGLSTLELLQKHPDDEVYNEAARLLDEYFCVDEEEE